MEFGKGGGRRSWWIWFGHIEFEMLEGPSNDDV